MKAVKNLIVDILQETFGSNPSLSPEAVWRSFEVPKEEKFGDLSTHILLKTAKPLKKAPRELAVTALQAIEKSIGSGPLKGRLTKVAVDGPGFLNFFYAPQELAGVIDQVFRQGELFGRPQLASKKILLEFVSANPTGPLTVAHGRQAALGDSLCRILSFCGHAVHKEYYNNDEGVQINTLGLSLDLRIRQALTGQNPEIPENYYRGEYLIAIALDFIKTHSMTPAGYEAMEAPARHRLCSDFAKDSIMRTIVKDLEDFGVRFDTFYSQRALAKSGNVEKTLDRLRQKGVVYEQDGAVWFRSTGFGDDKDRVLIKSDKNYTYLTPDIAYHDDKFTRGFDALVNIWGPDHHGYIARLVASQTALGHDPKAIDVLIAQLVTLYEGAKQVRMSTRAGEFVTLRQVLDEVGPDAGRFFFLMRKFDAHLDFDLELAKSQTPENPVFYIQYAHARIESIKSQAPQMTGKEAGAADLERLTHPSEQRLLKLLIQYQDQVLAAERTLEPYRVVAYLIDLAGAFHRFYAENRVLSEDAALSRARMALAVAVQTVLRSGLTLLGISAPLKM